MALVGNMIADAFGGNPSTVNYAIFTAAFSMLSLFYLLPASMSASWVIHPILMVVVDALNAIFFFCGGIAMAAQLHAHSCSNQVSPAIPWSKMSLSNLFRPTSIVTKLPTAPPTVRSAVVRPRPRRPSSGLLGLVIWSRSFSRSSCRDPPARVAELPAPVLVLP